MQIGGLGRKNTKRRLCKAGKPYGQVAKKVPEKGTEKPGQGRIDRRRRLR